MCRLVLLVVLAACAVSNAETLRAIVKLKGESVNGEVTFTQAENQGGVLIEGTVSGLPAGLYGFHVLEDGEIGEGCKTSSGHFNPYNQDHGHPDDLERHVGDLGNIKFGEDRVAKVSIRDSAISLNGERSIVGRAVVVTSGEDDHGHSSHPHSHVNGNSGEPVTCGVVQLV